MSGKRLFIMAFGLFMAAAAAAQAEDDKNLEFLGSVAQRYDDNITSARYGAKDDFVTTARLGVRMTAESKRSFFKLSGTLDYDFFASSSGYNNFSQDASAEYKKEFSVYDRVIINADVRHAEEPGSFDEALGTASGRYSYMTGSSALTYIRDLSRKSSAYLKYTFGMKDFSRKSMLDSYINTAGLGYNYYLLSTRLLSFGYDYSRRDFDPGPYFTASQRLWSGLSEEITPKLSAELKLGVDRMRSASGEHHTRPLAITTFNYLAGELTSASLSVSSQSVLSADQLDLFDSSRVSFGLKHRISRRSVLNFLVFYGKGRYVNSNIKDKLSGIDLKFTYEINTSASAFAGYSRSETDSNLDDRGYVRNTYSAGINWEF